MLSDKKTVNIDNVYSDARWQMYRLGQEWQYNHRWKRYPGTPGLYELIFKKFPVMKLSARMLTSRNTKAFYWRQTHRCGHSTHNPIMGNKGHKYKSTFNCTLVW